MNFKKKETTNNYECLKLICFDIQRNNYRVANVEVFAYKVIKKN